jgi:hypothetical protein
LIAAALAFMDTVQVPEIDTQTAIATTTMPDRRKVYSFSRDSTLLARTSIGAT